MSGITIRDLQAVPGETVFGGVKCGEWADGSPVTVPLTIAQGRESGPVVLAIGCMHGDEMVGTESIRRVVDELDPTTMRGSFIGVLAANSPAFKLGARVNLLEHPTGANDLKRVLRTAQSTGSMTERLAAFLRDEVVPHCDHYIDLHSSALGSYNHPRAIVAGDNLEIDAGLRAKIDRMAEACDFEYIFKPRGDSWKGMYFAPSFPFEEDYGKAGIILETGSAPTSDGVDILVSGIRNILGAVGLVDQEPARTVPLTYLDQLVATRANRGGLWRPLATTPDKVAEGDVLGHVVGLDGSIKEEISAPTSGVVVKVATNATISTGVRTHVLGVPANGA